MTYKQDLLPDSDAIKYDNSCIDLAGISSIDNCIEVETNMILVANSVQQTSADTNTIHFSIF